MESALSTQDGSEKWSFKTNGKITNSATVASDMVIFGNHEGSLFGVR